jgi:hypothetical protein
MTMTTEFNERIRRQVDTDEARMNDQALSRARAGKWLHVLDFGRALRGGLLPEDASIVLRVDDDPAYAELAHTEITELLDSHNLPAAGRVAARERTSEAAVIARGNTFFVRYLGERQQVQVLHLPSSDGPAVPISEAR